MTVALLPTASAASMPPDERRAVAKALGDRVYGTVVALRGSGASRRAP